MGLLSASSSPGSRRPQGTVLHGILRDDFSGYLSDRADAGRQVPTYAIAEVQQYLTCGDIRTFSATLQCPGCPFVRHIPLACKRRGWCPHCLTKRLWERSEFLRRSIIGNTPVRHWAQTVPPPLRTLLAYDPSLVSEVLAGHVESITRFLRRQAKSLLGLKSVTQAFAGLITVIQRFSTDLSLNPHFHTIATDGVYVQLTPDSELTFHPLPRPTRREIEAVAWDTCQRTLKVLARRGLWRETHRDDELRRVTGELTLGKRAPRTLKFCGAAARREVHDAVIRNGALAFDLWAGQRVSEGDDKRLVKLLRYIMNPPFTDNQLTLADDADVLFSLKRTRRDGTDTLKLTRPQFLDKLVNITPHPRANLIRFHGVYAPNSHLRDQVVPPPPPPPPAPAGDNHTAEDYRAWGELGSRAFINDIMWCPHCSKRLQLTKLDTPTLKYRRKIRTAVPPDTP